MMIMEQKKPRVSVIIPTYNRASVIKRSVESVALQCFQDMEIIIIDDGSSDNTKEIIDRLNDNRIRYIRHETNRGVAASRNTGIQSAQGEYIAFQDSDDEWLPEKLEKQVAVLDSATDRADVVYSQIVRYKKGKKIIMPTENIKKEGHIYHEIFFLSVFLQTVLVRKRCFDSVGLFDESLLSFEDKVMLIHLAKDFEFRFIEEPLVVSHVMPDSLILNLPVFAAAATDLIGRYHDEFSRNKQLYARILFWMGQNMCVTGGGAEGRKFIRRAMRMCPLNIKYIIGYILTLVK